MVRFFLKKVADKLQGKSSKAASLPDSVVAKPQSAHGETFQPVKEKGPQPGTSDAESGRPKRRRNRNRKPRREGETRLPDQDAGKAPAPASTPPAKAEDWNVMMFDVPPSPGKTRFHDLNLRDELMHAIAESGFEYCTPIQAQILPHTLLGKDAFGKAQTGTGKTAAFLIAIMDNLLRRPIEGERKPGVPRALILAPTRELATQIVRDAEELNTYCGFNVVAVYGGMDYEKQKRQLQEKPVDLVVATPGRLLDFLRSQDVHLNHVEVLVLDEADRMLDMGFIPDVRTIIHRTPTKNHRQTLFFSATLNDTIQRLSSQWTQDPVTVEIEPEQVAVDTVDQVVYIVTEAQKFALLHYELNRPEVERAIIFVNRRDHGERLNDNLQRYGHKSELISGAVPQRKRMNVLDGFKAGEFPYLVATDVAGRGIHIDGVTHVINFNLPEDPEDYVHRIGRTGRAGSSGQSISFATESESFFIPDIEAFIKRDLKCVVPEDAWLVLPEPSRPARPREPRQDRPGNRGGRSGGGGGRGGPRRSSGGGSRSSGGRGSRRS